MSLPTSIKTFIDESPISLVAHDKGSMSVSEIQAFYDEEVKPQVKDAHFGKLAFAGLLMAQNYIWEAHEIVQDYEDVEASWWHAFMHRMEGDYGNANYWYRGVGTPVYFSSLLEAVQKLDFHTEASNVLKWQEWDSFKLNDMISSSTGDYRDELHDIHRLECLLILKVCYTKATQG
ncbi:MAG: hypothetical protein NE334_14450 [Lentisphaeraceae bacterium]|nr:hypothetical protein [Lentisphaeraceae bacterium]